MNLGATMLCFAERSSGSNNKSGSQRRAAEGSASKSGFAKSLGATIRYSYPSLDVQVFRALIAVNFFYDFSL